MPSTSNPKFCAHVTRELHVLSRELQHFHKKPVQSAKKVARVLPYFLTADNDIRTYAPPLACAFGCAEQKQLVYTPLTAGL